MAVYGPPTEPPVDYWEEYEKPRIVQNKIQEACEDIVKKGTNTRFQEIFDIIYEHIIENLEKFD